MVLLNTFRNILLRKCSPKYKPSAILRSSDSGNKNPCEESDKKGIESINKKPFFSVENNQPPRPRQIFIESDEDIRKRQLQKCKVLLREAENYYLISGVPIDITCFKIARVYQPRKNAMQSGTRHVGHWEIDFETKERWKNPLMGWCASGDALSNLKMKFSTKEEAITYCKKNNMKYWVQQSQITKKFKVKDYGNNFHYKKRTRVQSK